MSGPELKYSLGQNEIWSMHWTVQMEILDFIASIIAQFQHLRISEPCPCGIFGWDQKAFIFDIQMPLYISAAGHCAVLRSPSLSQRPENHTQCGMKLCGISESTDRKNQQRFCSWPRKTHFPLNASCRHIHLNRSVFLCCFNRSPSYREIWGGKSNNKAHSLFLWVSIFYWRNKQNTVTVCRMVSQSCCHICWTLDFIRILITSDQPSAATRTL